MERVFLAFFAFVCMVRCSTDILNPSGSLMTRLVDTVVLFTVCDMRLLHSHRSCIGSSSIAAYLSDTAAHCHSHTHPSHTYACHTIETVQPAPPTCLCLLVTLGVVVVIAPGLLVFLRVCYTISVTGTCLAGGCGA